MNTIPRAKDKGPDSEYVRRDGKHLRQGSDPLYQTARGRLQSRRSRLNEQINREIRLRTGAENLLRATNNTKLRDTVSRELSYVNSNLQLLKEEMSDLNSSVDIYQNSNCAQCIPMIPLGLKETKDIDFVAPFNDFISEHYHENGESFLSAIEDLQKIRQACRTPVRSPDGVELLFRYYNQLYFIEKRFFGPHGNLGLQMEWYDSLTGVPSSQGTMGFEKGSVLFNIGALLTQMATRQDRSQPEGLDEAIHCFRKAAGAFRYLKEHFTNAPSQDMHSPTLDMLSHLMLAQSQECCLEKTVLSSVPQTISAHISFAHEAAQVSELYQDAHKLMSQDPVCQYTPPPWLSLVLAKSHYYRALSHYHTAIAVTDTADNSDVDVLTQQFADIHVWNPNRKFETGSVAASVPTTTDDRKNFARAHLRQGILKHEEALQEHGQSRQLRKIDTFLDVLRKSHDRSLMAFSELEEEDDFSDLMSAPAIQPKSEELQTLLLPEFSEYKVEDLFHNLGPLVIFSARHRWTPVRRVCLKKEAGQEFGFSVRGDSPVIVALVESASLAQKCGMRIGDFIVAVGDLDTRWHRHEETVSLIRQAGATLSLTLVTPLDRNYLSPESSPGTASLPASPETSQKRSGAREKKPGHRKTASGSSGSGWTLRRKRSSSKDSHLVESGKTELHAR